MLALTLLAVSVGLADSVNPATVGPALYLATRSDARRRLVPFTLGVFAVYFLGGLILTAGPGRAILSAIPHPGRRETHLLELGLGGLALVVAAGMLLGREKIARHADFEERRVARSDFALGAAIMVVELPTAFPYFAVIAAVIASSQNLVRQLAVVAVFNVCFVAPLAAIVALRAVANPRAERALAVARKWLDRHAGTLVLGTTLVLAAALLTIGAVGLAR
jgi:cytochrome c biogenesis protein CcdA